MIRKLRDQVVVIIGASSGIGRATAHAFARRGSILVLAARGHEALEKTLEECEAAGGRGLAIALDARSAEDVEALCQTAVSTYDRIDVWINCAAVSLYGRLDEVPADDYERVLETNIVGCVNGARAALRQFRQQGRGHLINLASVAGRIGQPYVSAYVTSKWAVLGLSECLRMEVRDQPAIHVSSVLPASIDTPFFHHAGNYSGREVKALSPVYAPEQVAGAILRLVRRPKRELFVGGAGRMLALLRVLAPSLGERVMAAQVERDHFTGRRVPPSCGTIYEPSPGPGRVHGGWARSRSSRSTVAQGLLLAAMAVPFGIYAYRRWRSS